MSTASRKRNRTARNDASLVAQLCGEVSALSRRAVGPAPDRVMNRLLDDHYDATAHLAGAPSASAADVQAKLTILCGRLRENLHSGHRGELLTYLLAEAIREDCRLLFHVDVPIERSRR